MVNFYCQWYSHLKWFIWDLDMEHRRLWCWVEFCLFASKNFSHSIRFSMYEIWPAAAYGILVVQDGEHSNGKISVDMMNDTTRDILKRGIDRNDGASNLVHCKLHQIRCLLSSQLMILEFDHLATTCDLWMSKLGRPSSTTTTSNFGPLNHYSPHI